MNRCRGGKRAVVGGDGEGVEGAVGVVCSFPLEFFAGGQEGGAWGNGNPGGAGCIPFLKGAGGEGVDAEREGVTVDVGLIGSGGEIGVGDLFEGVLGCTGDGGDGAEGRSVG